MNAPALGCLKFVPCTILSLSCGGLSPGQNDPAISETLVSPNGRISLTARLGAERGLRYRVDLNSSKQIELDPSGEIELSFQPFGGVVLVSESR